MLSSFREAYNDIISTALKNASVASAIISHDILCLCYNTLLMNKLLPQFCLSTNLLHRHFVSKSYFLLLLW